MECVAQLVHVHALQLWFGLYVFIRIKRLVWKYIETESKLNYAQQILIDGP